MNKPKWYSILIVGLALVLISLALACAKRPETAPATKAPDFTLQSIDGKEVTLSKFRGRPVMVNFWTTHCGFCMLQMPYIQAFYNELSNEEVVVLTIDTGESATVVRDFGTSQGFTFPVLVDPQGVVAKAYGIPGVPVTFFIDAEGFLKAYKIGPFQSRQEIEGVVKTLYPSITIATEPRIGSELGNRALDFTLQTISGKSMTLSALRGKIVVVTFWTSSCQACADEMPYFQAVFDKWSPNQILVLAVNVGDNITTVQSLVDKLGLTFPILLDPSGTVCTDYRHGSPTTFFLDGRGIIKAIKDGIFQSQDEIENILKALKSS